MMRKKTTPRGGSNVGSSAGTNNLNNSSSNMNASVGSLNYNYTMAPPLSPRKAPVVRNFKMVDRKDSNEILFDDISEDESLTGSCFDRKSNANANNDNDQFNHNGNGNGNGFLDNNANNSKIDKNSNRGGPTQYMPRRQRRGNKLLPTVSVASCPSTYQQFQHLRPVWIIVFIVCVAVVSSFTLSTLKASFDSLSPDLSIRESWSDVVKEPVNAFDSSLIPSIIRESEKPPSRISYTLHPKALRLYNNTFNEYFQCPIAEEGLNKRRGLPAEMKNTTGVLDFTTSVTTDLKILFMGDSVSMQCSQGFEEAAGALHAHRSVLRYMWERHECLTVSAPVKGGGVVAGWRLTGLLNRRKENKPLPNSGGGGWVREDVHNLTAHTYNATSNDQGEEESEESKAVGSFDVMVIRIPHGWMTLNQISERALKQTVNLAHKLFGVSSIVFMSLPFVNNVQTMENLRLLNETNALIRDFVRKWEKSGDAGSGVKHLLLLEFGDFVDSLMEWNSRLMGFDTSVTNYTMERLRWSKHSRSERSIAQLCSTRVPVGSIRCERNSISKDGMHWCMETIGGRVFAGTSCLLACAFNNETRDGSTDSATTSTTAIRQCEQRCNDDFMSLKSVDVSSTLHYR
jgi:hypothetical protein